MNKNTRKERHKQDGLNSHTLEDRPNLLLSYSKNYNLKVSFKTKNTIGKLLTQNKNINPNKFNKCGVRQLTCHDCNRKYIGQRGRLFYIRFNEHFHDYKYGNGKPNLHNIFQIIKILLVLWKILWRFYIQQKKAE